MNAPLHQLALQQLHDALQSASRVIFVHPNYVPNHILFNTLIKDAAYVRFHGIDLDSTALNDQLDAMLDEQDVRMASLTSDDKVILDECDRALRPDFDAFLKHLLERYAVKLIVISRIVPSIMLHDQGVRATTRMIPATDSQMLWDYTQHDSSGGVLLEVRALGDGRVQVNGENVDNWDGQLPRALFFFLVDRGMVTRNEIFETFWPALTTREATNVFHVTKRKISEVLGIDLTVYWSGFYHISPRINLSYDVALFTRMIQDSAVMPVQEAMLLAQQAIDVYRGDFLTSVDMSWSEHRRQDLRQIYGEILIALAKNTEKLDQPCEALGLYLQAATTHRQREDLVSSIMSLYRTLAMPHDALLVYRRLEQDLSTALDVAPMPALRELAAQIERDIERT